jgi:hypothetical protein
MVRIYASHTSSTSAKTKLPRKHSNVAAAFSVATLATRTRGNILGYNGLLLPSGPEWREAMEQFY